MKLRNVATGTLVLTLLFLTGCGQEGGIGKGNPVSVAEQFMDLYYKQGKPQEAKALVTPEAVQHIDEVLESAGEKATDHEVSYILKEKTQEGEHSYALFQLTITRKDAEPLYKTTSLFVDLIDGAWQVTLFDEKKENGPHQEISTGGVE